MPEDCKKIVKMSTTKKVETFQIVKNMYELSKSSQTSKKLRIGPKISTSAKVVKKSNWNPWKLFPISVSSSHRVLNSISWAILFTRKLPEWAQRSLFCRKLLSWIFVLWNLFKIKSSKEKFQKIRRKVLKFESILRWMSYMQKVRFFE